MEIELKSSTWTNTTGKVINCCIIIKKESQTNIHTYKNITCIYVFVHLSPETMSPTDYYKVGLFSYFKKVLFKQLCRQDGGESDFQKLPPSSSAGL